MIRRSEHSADKRFFLFTRKTAQDKHLSFQATGLLAYVLSKPPGWTAKDADLMKRGGIKSHALNTILDELKKHGYAQRVRERVKGGKFDFFLEIAEEPIFINDSPLCDFPVVDEPLADNQVVAIDSTCASACSSEDLTDLREKRTPPKRSHKEPQQEVVLDPPYHSKSFEEALTSYETHTRERGSKVTLAQRTELYRVLQQCGGEQIAIDALKMAVRCGWKGVFPERLNSNGYHDVKPVQRVQTIRERMGLAK